MTSFPQEFIPAILAIYIYLCALTGSHILHYQPTSVQLRLLIIAALFPGIWLIWYWGSYLWSQLRQRLNLPSKEPNDDHSS